jgi:glucose-1-phosphate thymidylyltransferase
MKGILLAGGLGTRLRPLTNVVNKHLLPVGSKPMIFYPLDALADAGIEDVMIVVGGQSTEAIMKLCKDGRQWGFKSLYYVYQEGEGGIAAALALTEKFVNKDDCCVVLGDNIMLGDSLRPYMRKFREASNRNPMYGKGALVLAARVKDPENYGVPTMEKDSQRILFITEKPINPATQLGIIGVYFYDATVFDRIRTCSPSKRGELEITDVNNSYAADGDLAWSSVKGQWIDAGSSIEAWVAAGKLVEDYQKKHEEFPELLQK